LLAVAEEAAPLAVVVELVGIAQMFLANLRVVVHLPKAHFTQDLELLTP
jgi:hypothetical protein